jgi:cell division protein FtsB
MKIFALTSLVAFVSATAEAESLKEREHKIEENIDHLKDEMREDEFKDKIDKYYEEEFQSTADRVKSYIYHIEGKNRKAQDETQNAVRHD